MLCSPDEDAPSRKGVRKLFHVSIIGKYWGSSPWRSEDLEVIGICLPIYRHLSCGRVLVAGNNCT